MISFHFSLTPQPSLSRAIRTCFRPFSPIKILPPNQKNKNTIVLTTTDNSVRTMSSSLFDHDDHHDDAQWAHHPQLDDELHFRSLLSPHDHLLSICGFGSLLSERSARSTFPDLLNFRIARLIGFRRVFAHVAPIFFERGIANPQTREISSLSVEPCEGESLVVTVFEIKESEIPDFIEREHEFRFLSVIPQTLEGASFTRPAVLCARYSDEEYFKVRCKGSKEIYYERYGRYNIDKIWRDDILPCRVYLRHCVLAAKNLSGAAYDNFLDHTFLADRKTTIREYLATDGSGIMEEEPPGPLKNRYGG